MGLLCEMSITCRRRALVLVPLSCGPEVCARGALCPPPSAWCSAGDVALQHCFFETLGKWPVQNFSQYSLLHFCLELAAVDACIGCTLLKRTKVLLLSHHSLSTTLHWNCWCISEQHKRRKDVMEILCILSTSHEGKTKTQPTSNFM